MIKGVTKVELFAEKIEGSEEVEFGQPAAQFLVGEVSYSKGGTNYFSGGYTKRGYRLMVHMRKRSARSESFVIGGGIGKGEFIEEAKMFSAKRLEVLSHDPAILERLQNLKAECLAIYRAKHAQVESEAVAV